MSYKCLFYVLFLKSKLISTWFLGGCMPPCLIKICKVIIFKVFSHWCRRLYMLGGIFFIDAGDFTCLGKIESRRETPSQCGRVGIPAEAEGKKCNFQTQFVQLPGFCQHFTENPFFISNKHDKILTSIMSIPPTFPLFFYHVYDKILAIIISIPPTFNVLMNLPKVPKLL